MKAIYFNSARAFKRAIEKQQKIKNAMLLKKIEEQMANRRILSANDPFSKIQPDLVKLGWKYEEGLYNVVHSIDFVEITETPAVRLVTEKFNMTLIPYETGIEISRFEVWETYQGQGYASLFLDNLLRFLIMKDIADIYVLPGIAGIGKSMNSLAHNSTLLHKFYSKRGFQKMEDSDYWKLLSFESIDVDKLDLTILSKNGDNL